jgi:hypothetical protein
MGRIVRTNSNPKRPLILTDIHLLFLTKNSLDHSKSLICKVLKKVNFNFNLYLPTTSVLIALLAERHFRGSHSTALEGVLSSPFIVTLHIYH